MATMPNTFLSPVATKKFSELYNTPGQKEVLEKETEELLVPILKNLKYKFRENIMDHGCGTGRVGAKYIVPVADQTMSRVYAVDHSESMIEFAKAHHAHQGVTYWKTDLLHPDFPLGHIKFHKIFSVHVFAVIAEWRETFQKMFELLRPGGSLVVMFVSKSSDFFALLQHLKTHEEWSWHGESIGFPDFILRQNDAEEEVEKALQEIGFNVLSIDTHPRTHVFPSVAEAIELYMAAYPGAHEKNLKDPTHRHQVHDVLHKHAHELRKDCIHNKDKEKHTVFYETIVIYAEKPRPIE